MGCVGIWLSVGCGCLTVWLILGNHQCKNVFAPHIRFILGATNQQVANVSFRCAGGRALGKGDLRAIQHGNRPPQPTLSMPTKWHPGVVSFACIWPTAL